MPFRTDKFSFAAPPKCGTVWALSAFPAAGIDCGRKPGVYVHEPGRYQKPHRSITVTRDPADWYASVYPMLVAGKGRDTVVAPLASMNLRTFGHFIDDVIERLPGFATRVFRMYESTHAVPLGDIDAMCDALRACGVEFDEHALRAIKPLNVTADKPVVDEGCRAQLVAIEDYVSAELVA